MTGMRPSRLVLRAFVSDLTSLNWQLLLHATWEVINIWQSIFGKEIWIYIVARLGKSDFAAKLLVVIIMMFLLTMSIVGPRRSWKSSFDARFVSEFIS